MPEGGSRTFVVTGCGRSGTEYIARALEAAGLRCGHEVLFNPRTRAVPAFGAVDGDVSWLAAPFVEALPAGTAVLHQVRDPFAVTASWFGLRFLADGGPYSFRRPSGPPRLLYHEVTTRLARRRGRAVYVARDYERFVARHLPRVYEAGTTLERCMRYWTGWNEMVEDGARRSGLPYLRYRVDEVPARWAEIAALVGCPDAPLPGAAGAGATAAERPNARPHHDVLTWDVFAAANEFPRVAELAARYGFDLQGASPP